MLSRPAKPNLYLVGFMATGKSTLGTLAADRLEYDFLDSDLWIEEQEGMPVADIFREKGESYFRQCERRFVDEGHPDQGCVISCGGGLVTGEGMVDALKRRGVVVTLWAKPETVLHRTQGKQNRPLLDVQDPLAEIRRLMELRRPFYAKAGVSILTDGRGQVELVKRILDVYHEGCKAFPG